MLRTAGADVVFDRDHINRSGLASQKTAAVDESYSAVFSPLFGFSDGQAKQELFKREYKEYCAKSQKSSLSRSRSRSKAAKLKEAMKEAETFLEEGIVGQM